MTKLRNNNVAKIHNQKKLLKRGGGITYRSTIHVGKTARMQLRLHYYQLKTKKNHWSPYNFCIFSAPSWGVCTQHGSNSPRISLDSFPNTPKTSPQTSSCRFITSASNPLPLRADRFRVFSALQNRKSEFPVTINRKRNLI